jgi:hypothetical protein
VLKIKQTATVNENNLQSSTEEQHMGRIRNAGSNTYKAEVDYNMRD